MFQGHERCAVVTTQATRTLPNLPTLPERTIQRRENYSFSKRWKTTRERTAKSEASELNLVHTMTTQTQFHSLLVVLCWWFCSIHTLKLQNYYTTVTSIQGIGGKMKESVSLTHCAQRSGLPSTAQVQCITSQMLMYVVVSQMFCIGHLFCLPIQQI